MTIRGTITTANQKQARSIVLAGLVWAFALSGTLEAARSEDATRRGSSSQSLGMQAPRSANLDIVPAKKSRRAAPNLEDHADYFSEARGATTSQDLKKADEIRVKTINSIKKLIADQKPKAPRNFELLLRLGELHVERHDYIRDLEADAYAKAWKSWESKAESQRGPEPKLTYRLANQELAKAANAFRRLVAEYPRHPRSDAAMFALAKTLGRLDDDNAESYYNQLIKTWPKSPLIPDAQLALGEFHFEKHNMPKAMAGYKATMQFKDHPAYPYAVYKLGWAYFNSAFKDTAEQGENYKKSITAFKLVIKLADSGRNKGNLDLRKEAIKDLVMVWAETEDVDGAWKYFRTIGEESAFYTMLEKLGGIYADQGKNDKAIETFERLTRESPARLSTPEIHTRLVELYDLVAREDEAAATLRAMPETFKPNGKWAAANAKNPEATGKAWSRVEKLLHRWGTLYHNRGQKAKNEKLTGLAATIYETYLASFTDGAAAYEIRFYLAEIQFDQGKYEPAAANYSLVANARPKDGKFKRNAALNAVAAMNKQVEAKGFAKLQPAGKVVPRADIPREKVLLVRYMDDYSKLLPSDPDGFPMRYTAAVTFMQHGQFEEGLKRLNAIVSEIPATAQGKAAITVVIGYEFERKNWTGVIETAGRIDSIKAFTSDESIMKARNTLFAQALFNRAADAEKSGEYSKAATDYLAYQREFPRDANADRALYNASVAYAKAARPEDAMASGRKLLDTYPQSRLRAEVLADLGQTAEALADFGTAAKWYTDLGRSFPNDKRSPHAIFNAAVLSKALGRLEAAEGLFSEMRRMWPQHELAKEATIELANVQEKRERHLEAATTWAALAGMKGVDHDTQMLAMTRKAKIMAIHLKEASARHELDRIRISLGRKDAPPALQARQELAETLFSQVDAGFQQFMSARISGSTSVESQIQAKQGILERVAAGYEAVIAIGSPEHTVASLYRLGEMHEDFAEKLFNAQPPTGKTAAQALAFRSRLDKLAFPLKEEAGKFFDVAHKRSSEVETFSVWTSRVEAKVAEIAGKKTGSDALMVLSPGYVSQKFALNKATRELID